MFFWASATMRGDPLCFVERGEGAATAALLFPPDGRVQLCSAAGDLVYEEGRDFALDTREGIVLRTAGSRIPVTRRDELYVPNDAERTSFMFKRGAPDTCLMFDETGLFHQRQVRAAYTHRPGSWTGPVPAFRGGDAPRTMHRLRARQSLSIAVTGDSISEGYNASGFLRLPPHQPPYVDLVADGLTAEYGGSIAMHNFASAGWTTDQGVDDASRVGSVHPDLVIVAFGMNDAGYASADEFAGNIAAIMDGVRQVARNAEFVLVSPMLPNPEWHYPIPERFPEYRHALAALCGDGVLLADVTQLWGNLLGRKSIYDLTGNGINHPNDFGHRAYAEVVLSLLVDVEKPASAPT